MEVVAELIKQGANVDAATKVCATQESHKHTITHTGTLCMHEFTDTHTHTRFAESAPSQSHID